MQTGDEKLKVDSEIKNHNDIPTCWFPSVNDYHVRQVINGRLHSTPSLKEFTSFLDFHDITGLAISPVNVVSKHNYSYRMQYIHLHQSGAICSYTKTRKLVHVPLKKNHHW